MKGLSILGVGSALPKNSLKNEDLTRWVETSDEWIKSRTGIENRHFCGEDESTATLAAAAAEKAIAASGISKEDISLCIVATFTAGYSTPSASCEVHQILGLPKHAACFDLGAACSGFVFGLQTAAGLLPTMPKPYALVIGSEAISKQLDYADRSTLVLFGDGAGAAVVALKEAKKFCGCMYSNGDVEALYAHHTQAGNVFKMNGSAIFRFAVETVPPCIVETAQKAGVPLAEIDYIVCHQANKRIISYVADKMELPAEKFYVNIEKYGNTSAASIPLALADMADEGLLTPGVKIICVGFGAGLTWGGVYLEF